MATQYPVVITGGRRKYLPFADDLAIGVGTANAKLTVEGAVSTKEISTPTSTAAYGKWYAKDVAGIAEAHYLDDTGQEVQITSNGAVNAAGGGTIGGSIADNQIAVGAATADDIEGSAALTFDGDDFKLEVDQSGFTQIRVVNNTNAVSSGAGLVVAADGGSLTLEHWATTGGSGFNDSAVIQAGSTSAGIHIISGNNTSGFVNFRVGTSNAKFTVGLNEVVVADSGVEDIDFRVESSTFTHGLFYDASASVMGVNESSPDTVRSRRRAELLAS